MKKKKKHPGIREKEVNQNPADVKLMNPAVVPMVPGVLNTASTPADMNQEFVSSSAPLAEKLPTTPSKSDVPAETPKEKQEYFNPTTTPLGEKPQKSAAVTSRTQPARRKADESNQTRSRDTTRP